ncbi:MAG: 4-vinyl reductase [Candidatus Nanoarchaeia archaeon]|nr:4-vinyl reductase [Candidatus Nanoarchaeia archaeon]
MDLDFINKIISLDFFLDAATSILKKDFEKFKDSRMMRIETFSLTQEILEKYTGKAALLLFFNLGKMSADSIMEEKKIKNKSVSNLINEAIDFTQQRKWIKIIDKKSFANEISITTEWTLQSKNRSKTNYCVCSFIEGFFEKVLSYSSDEKTFSCKEVKCLARGDKYCEFRIKQN